MNQTPQTPPSGPIDDTADALLHLRPQLKHAASHPLCPAALRVALPLLDAVITGQQRQLGDMRAELMDLRRQLSLSKA